MMKKLLLLLVSVLLCIVFVACDREGVTTGTGDTTTADPGTSNTPEEATTDEPTTDEPTTDEPSEDSSENSTTSQPPPVLTYPEPDQDYTFVDHDGIHYIVFDNNSRYVDADCDFQGADFSSLEDFKYRVDNYYLDNGDKLGAFNRTQSKDEFGLWCVDFDDLRYPVFPENMEIKDPWVYWYGAMYEYSLHLSSSDSTLRAASFEIMTREEYNRVYHENYLNFTQYSTDVTTRQLEYRDAVFTKHTSKWRGLEWVVQYRMEAGGNTFMIKAVKDNFRNGSAIDPETQMPEVFSYFDIYWTDGEYYYRMMVTNNEIDITEEWLAQWGSISYEQYMAEKEAAEDADDGTIKPDDDVTDIVGPPDYFSLGSMEDLRSLLEASVSQMSDEAFSDYFDTLDPTSSMGRYQLQRLSGYLENTWLPYLKPEVTAEAFSVEFTAGASGEAEIKRDYMNVNYQIDGVQYQFSYCPHMSIPTPEGEPLYGDVALGSTAVDLYLHERGDRLIGYYTAGDIVVRLTIWDYDDATAFDRILQMFEPTPWNAS